MKLIFALSVLTAITLMILPGCRALTNAANGVLAWGPLDSHATMAEKETANGRYREAITLYQKHMEKRYRDTKRAPDENPAFYELKIGELYLKLKEPDEALAAFERAKTKNVDDALVIDRMRQLADFYVAEQQTDKAIAVLRAQRPLDPDIFDADIDALHKNTIAAEDRRSVPVVEY